MDIRIVTMIVGAVIVVIGGLFTWAKSDPDLYLDFFHGRITALCCVAVVVVSCGHLGFSLCVYLVNLKLNLAPKQDQILDDLFAGEQSYFGFVMLALVPLLIACNVIFKLAQYVKNKNSSQS